MFVYLVNVFNAMPAGRIIGAIFYICVLFAGVSSIVNPVSYTHLDVYKRQEFHARLPLHAQGDAGFHLPANARQDGLTQIHFVQQLHACLLYTSRCV